MQLAFPFRYTYSYFKEGCHSQQSILKPRGTLGTVIASNNVPTKVTVWLWHYLEPAVCPKSLLIVIDYLCCMLEPAVPFCFSIDY